MNKKFIAVFIISIFLNSSLQLHSAVALFQDTQSLDKFAVDVSKTKAEDFLKLLEETKIIATKKGSLEFREKNSNVYKFLVLVVNQEKVEVTVELKNAGVYSFIGFDSSVDNVKVKKSDSRKVVFEIEPLDSAPHRTLISLLFSSNSNPEISVKSNKGKIILLDTYQEFEDFLNNLHSLESISLATQAYKDIFGKQPFLQIKIENVIQIQKDPRIDAIVNYLNSPRGTTDLNNILSGKPFKIDKIPNSKDVYYVATDKTGSKIGIFKNNVPVAVADIKAQVQAKSNSDSSPQKPVGGTTQAGQQSASGSCESRGFGTCPNGAGCFLNSVSECFGLSPTTTGTEKLAGQKKSPAEEALDLTYPGAKKIQPGETCQKGNKFCVSTQCVGAVPEGYTLCRRNPNIIRTCEAYSTVVLDNCYECGNPPVEGVPTTQPCKDALKKRSDALNPQKKSEIPTQPQQPQTPSQPKPAEQKSSEEKTEGGGLKIDFSDPKILIAAGAIGVAGFSPDIKDFVAKLYREHIKNLAKSELSKETLKSSFKPIVFSIFDEQSKKFHLSFNIPNDAVKNMDLGVFDKEIAPGVRLNINKKVTDWAEVTVFTEKEGQVYKVAFNPEKNSKSIAQIISQDERGFKSYEDPEILKIDAQRAEISKKMEESIKAQESGDLVKAEQKVDEIKEMVKSIEEPRVKSKGILDRIREFFGAEPKEPPKLIKHTVPEIKEKPPPGPPEYKIKIIQEGNRKITGCAGCLTPDEEKRLIEAKSKPIDPEELKNKALFLNEKQTRENTISKKITEQARGKSTEINVKGELGSWKNKIDLEFEVGTGQAKIQRSVPLSSILDEAGKKSNTAIGARGSSVYLRGKEGKISLGSIKDIDLNLYSTGVDFNKLETALKDSFQKYGITVSSLKSPGPTAPEKVIKTFTAKFPDGTTKRIDLGFVNPRTDNPLNTILQPFFGDEAQKQQLLKNLAARLQSGEVKLKPIPVDIKDPDFVQKTIANHLLVMQEHNRFAKDEFLGKRLEDIRVKLVDAAKPDTDFKKMVNLRKEIDQLYSQYKPKIETPIYSQNLRGELGLVKTEVQEVKAKFESPLTKDSSITVEGVKGPKEMKGKLIVGNKNFNLEQTNNLQIIDDGKGTNVLIKRQTFVSGQGKPTVLDISVPEIETRPPPSLGDAIFVYDAEKNTYIFGKGAEYVDLGDGEKWISLEDGSLIKVNKGAEVINLDEFRASGEILDTSNPKIVSIIGPPKIKEVSGGRKIIDFKPIGGGAEVETTVRYVSELNPTEIGKATKAIEELSEGEKTTLVLNGIQNEFTKTSTGIKYSSPTIPEATKILTVDDAADLAGDLARSGAKIASNAPIGFIGKIAKTFGPLDIIATAAVPLIGLAINSFDDSLQRQTLYNTVENLAIEPSAIVLSQAAFGRLGLTTARTAVTGARIALGSSVVLAGVVAAELVAESIIEASLYRNSLSKMGVPTGDKKIIQTIVDDFVDFVDFSQAKSAIQSSKQYEDYVKNKGVEYIKIAEENAIRTGAREDFDRDLNNKLDGRKNEIDDVTKIFWDSGKNVIKIGDTTFSRNENTVIARVDNSEGILTVRYENINGELKPISYDQTRDLSKAKPSEATEFDVSNLGVGYVMGDAKNVIDINAIERKASEDARERILEPIKADMEELLNAKNPEEAAAKAREIARKLNENFDESEIKKIFVPLDPEIKKIAGFDQNDILDIVIKEKERSAKYYEDAAKIDVEGTIGYENLAEIENDRMGNLIKAKDVPLTKQDDEGIKRISDKEELGDAKPVDLGTSFCEQFSWFPTCQVPTVEASTETTRGAAPKTGTTLTKSEFCQKYPSRCDLYNQCTDFTPEFCGADEKPTEAKGENLPRDDFCEKYPFMPKCLKKGECTEFTPEFCDQPSTTQEKVLPEYCKDFPELDECRGLGETIPQPSTIDYCKDYPELPECGGSISEGGATTTPDLTYDSDGDGIEDSQDPCPQDYFNTCNQPLSYDSDGDGIEDSQDPCPDDYFNTCQQPPTDLCQSQGYGGTCPNGAGCYLSSVDECYGAGGSGGSSCESQGYAGTCSDGGCYLYSVDECYGGTPPSSGTCESAGYFTCPNGAGCYLSSVDECYGAGGSSYCELYPDDPSCVSNIPYASIGKNFLNWLRSILIPS